MAFSTHFTPATFDTSLLPLQSVVMNSAGIVDPGPISNPAALGYSAANVEATIEGAALSIGIDSVIYDVSAQFPGATYYYGISVGYSTGAVTTVSADNGIRGTGGREVVFDPLGSDVIDTRGGDDLVFAGGGDNAVRTGSGNDIVVTAVGNDTVDAGGGHDFIFLFAGDDVARGGGGFDTILGEAGNDCLDGQGGRDDLNGGTGDDDLFGGRGRDTLTGAEGADTLTGDAGRDTFVFGAGDGADLITDFEDTRDTLDLSLALGVASINDLAGIASQQGQDLVLSFAGGERLTLEDLTLSDLGNNNVDFV